MISSLSLRASFLTKGKGSSHSMASAGRSDVIYFQLFTSVSDICIFMLQLLAFVGTDLQLIELSGTKVSRRAYLPFWTVLSEAA